MPDSNDSTLNKVLSAFDKVKIFFGILGIVLGGGIFIAGPGTMSEEIPYHQEIGIAFILVGVLLVLALYSPWLKAFLGTLFIGAFALAAFFAASTSGDLTLKFFGFAAAGVVFGLIFITRVIDMLRGRDPNN